MDNAKVSTIESKVKEEIDLAVQSANLKIRIKKAEDNSWNAVTEGILPTTAIAKTETSNITNEGENGAVLVTLLADLQREGYNVEVTAIEGEGTGATRQITITYEGKDYQKAKKDNNAKITKTLDVSQNKIIYGVCSHNWNEEIISEASCTTAGSKKQICTICGETKTEKIATLPHTYGADEVCTVCGAKKLKIGAKINYHEYLDENGNAFTEMPSYTSKKGRFNNDQVFTVADNSGIEWIILGEENGQIKITTKNIVRTESDDIYYIRSNAGYTNLVKELNEISAIYGKGKHADTLKFEVTEGGITGGRSFIMEDLGYTFSRNGTAYTYALEKHEGDTVAKVYRYPAGAEVNGTSTTGGSYSKFEHMEQDASTRTEEGAHIWKSLSEENSYVTLYPYSYSGSQTLSTSIAKTRSGAYWLASRYVNFYDGYVAFYVRGVDSDGLASSVNLWNSYGNVYNSDYVGSGVRPVVYLKSDIQLSDYDSANNAYTIVEPGT